MTSHGQKVTTDPESHRRVEEAGGIVTSDSLAGESARSGGAFAENERAAVTDQPSYSTTTNTTDTSGARVLDAADDARSRKAQNPSSDSQILDEGVGTARRNVNDVGVGPTYNTRGGTTSSSGASTSTSSGSASGPGSGSSYSSKGVSSSNNAGSGSNASYGTRASDVDAAPAYVDAQLAKNQLSDDTGLPKGRNLKEVSDFGDAPNASEVTDIGGKNDPGRLAMQKEQRKVADSGLDAGGPKDTGRPGQGSFGTLSDERA